MKFECPNCYKDNDFDVEAAICCSHCETSIEGIKFKKVKTAFFSTMLTFASGGYIYNKIEPMVFGERLPISIEFEIVQSCLESDNRFITASIYKTKKQSCLCALDLVLQELDYDDYKDSPLNFQAEYVKKARVCL